MEHKAANMEGFSYQSGWTADPLLCANSPLLLLGLTSRATWRAHSELRQARELQAGSCGSAFKVKAQKLSVEDGVVVYFHMQPFLIDYKQIMVQPKCGISTLI